MAEQKFEEALRKLEEIVGDLESGELNLDDAIKKYEDGIKISSFCYNKLKDIEKKVEILIRDSSGKLSPKEFEEKSLTDEKLASKKRQTAKKKRPKGEELLF